MERLILALNCGSSSLKFGLYRSGESGGPVLVREGEAQEIRDHAAALAHTLEVLDTNDIAAVGHRIVHGGADVRAHQPLTPQIKEKLRAAVAFAPLHLPAALSVIEATERKLPKARQVVCLDTAFHREMPEFARTLALSAAVRRLGVERFGFHGLSLESILAQMDSVPERLVVAHLGNGASITAIREGQSIDTSMGLTPAGGIMMGTRSGDLDPGTIVYLMRKGYESAEKLGSVDRPRIRAARHFGDEQRRAGTPPGARRRRASRSRIEDVLLSGGKDDHVDGGGFTRAGCAGIHRRHRRACGAVAR